MTNTIEITALDENMDCRIDTWRANAFLHRAPLHTHMHSNTHCKTFVRIWYFNCSVKNIKSSLLLDSWLQFVVSESRRFSLFYIGVTDLIAFQYYFPKLLYCHLLLYKLPDMMPFPVFFGSGCPENGFNYFWITDSCPLTVKEVKNRQPFEVLSLASSIAATLHI